MLMMCITACLWFVALMYLRLMVFLGFGLQAYQVELESLAVKLEEENEKLLKEKVNFEI